MDHSGQLKLIHCSSKGDCEKQTSTAQRLKDDLLAVVIEKTALKEDMIALREELDVTKRCSGENSFAMPLQIYACLMYFTGNSKNALNSYQPSSNSSICWTHEWAVVISVKNMAFLSSVVFVLFFYCQGSESYVFTLKNLINAK